MAELEETLVKKEESSWDELIIPSTENFPFQPFCKQIIIFLRKSIPNLLTFFALTLFLFANLYMLKRQNSALIIAAYGLGLSWITILGFSVYITFSIGTLTLYSFAYGAKQYKVLGQQLWLARTFAIILFILLFPVMYYAENIFISFGISEETASMAQEFIMWAYPSLLISGLYETYRYFLYGQNIYTYPVYSQFMSYSLHIIWLYLFVERWQYGVKGVAICRNISFLLNLLILMICVERSGETKHTQIPFSFSFLKQLPNYLKTVVPSAAPDYLKWIIVEIMTILVGKLNDDNALAAHTACLNNNLIFVMFHLSVTITANAVLARAVGEGNVQKSKNIMKLNLIVCGVVFLWVGLLAQLIQGLFVELLTVGDEMGKDFIIVYRFMIYMVFLGDFFSTHLSIFLKSLGKQNIAMNTYMIIYYCIGLPMIWIFGLYTPMGLLGIWLGMGITALLVNSFLIYFVIQINIDETIKSIAKDWKEDNQIIVAKSEQLNGKDENYELKELSFHDE